MKPQVVLDASALIASIKREKGYEAIDIALDNGAVISAVNLAEVYVQMVSDGWDLQQAIPHIKALGLQIVPFGEDEAKISAELYPIGKSLGLSIGDRACLALGMKLGLPVLTADKTWSKLKPVLSEVDGWEIDVRVLR